ncbi:NPCBM/NEW2 domain-containing protein [Clostridium sp. AM58-1XD]|uniref:NPCBM/NEW2 domain-containing protein n=1 Tax=Clostridium sp. AM58-1XD TaxID=2292307 RepID=UPI00241E260D|nr:NPCBM/NEW2 domain-containing protein [Clostridium sp. AM58-1XD]
MGRKGRTGIATAVCFVMALSFQAEAGNWIPKDGGQWGYQKDDKTVAAGEWIQDKSQWYYFHPDGRMASGWEQIDGDWYYFLEGGAMATRWIQVDGKWYYMNLDGKMVSDTVIRNHVIGSDGAWIEVPESEKIERSELYPVTPSYMWDSVWTSARSTGTDGKEYTNNILISGKSLIEYDLDGEQKRFSCRIIPRSGFSSEGSVTIAIYGDYDEVLYQVENITSDSEDERIDVDITGQHVLGIKCIPDRDSEYDSVIINWPSIYQ